MILLIFHLIRIHITLNNHSFEFFDNAGKAGKKKENVDKNMDKNVNKNKKKANAKKNKKNKKKKEHMTNEYAPESLNINSQMNCKPRSFYLGQYGWSYLPPTTWSVPQQRPPVCLPSEPSNKVCAIYDSNIGSKYSEYLSRDAWETKRQNVEMVHDKNYYYPGYVGGFPVA